MTGDVVIDRPIVEVRIGARDADCLREHLFQSDYDEHAAVALAGVARLERRTVLLVRELHLIEEADFGPGEFGYRQTTARKVAELASLAEDEGLAYVALHSHPTATTSVGLSHDDLRAHQRLFPHLVNIVENPVAGLALGTHAAAGEVWLPSGEVVPLDLFRVVGDHLEVLRAVSDSSAAPVRARFDRQIRLFGADGQRILREARVAVVGCGGGGSLIVEQLAHLGVGRLTLIDFDVVKDVNLSRIVGATADDAKRQEAKVTVAERLVRRIDASIRVDAINGDIADASVAEHLLGCDFIFLATDTATSRLIVNAIVQRFFIPAIQIGAKVEVAGSSGVQIYAAVRPIFPADGCLDCAHLIDPMRLQEESRTDEERVAQNYLDVAEVVDPSVITLNAIGAAHATTTMLLWLTGLSEADGLGHVVYLPASGDQLSISVRADAECPFCSLSEKSAYGRGGSVLDLPVKRVRTATVSAENTQISRYGVAHALADFGRSAARRLRSRTFRTRHADIPSD